MTLADTIKEKRPKLSKSSIRTYVSILTNLFKALNPDKEFDDKYFEENHAQVTEHLKNKPPKQRKTILSALTVLCDETEACKHYRDLMMKDGAAADRQARQQKMTESEREKWMSYSELEKRYKSLQRQVKPLLTKDDLSNSEMQQVQNYVIFSLYMLIPPRRLLDYTEMKLRNEDKTKDNYIEKDKLVFNTYKTSKFYGVQKVEMPQKLKNILRKWTKKNQSDTFLIDTNGAKLTPQKLNQRLTKIVGVSVNMLRHIYITDKVLNGMPALQTLEKTAQDMGHDVQQQILYKRVTS